MSRLQAYEKFVLASMEAHFKIMRTQSTSDLIEALAASGKFTQEQLLYVAGFGETKTYQNEDRVAVLNHEKRMTQVDS